MTTQPKPTSHRNVLEVVATAPVALAAVSTVWSGYQAARWNGEATKASSRVNALRIEAARSQGLAEGQTQVDIAMFFEWADADKTGDAELASFYEDRFRLEFRPAFDAWLASAPDDESDPPGTPFALANINSLRPTTPQSRMPRRRRRLRSSGETCSNRPTTSWGWCCSPWPCSLAASAPR